MNRFKDYWIEKEQLTMIYLLKRWCLSLIEDLSWFSILNLSLGNTVLLRGMRKDGLEMQKCLTAMLIILERHFAQTWALHPIFSVGVGCSFKDCRKFLPPSELSWKFLQGVLGQLIYFCRKFLRGWRKFRPPSELSWKFLKGMLGQLIYFCRKFWQDWRKFR